ncbi:uncharacterized protein LOC144097816 [Amblyomma americanum]
MLAAAWLPPWFVAVLVCAQWATAGTGEQRVENAAVASAFWNTLRGAAITGSESPNGGSVAPPVRRRLLTLWAGNYSKATFSFCHLLLRMHHYRPSTNSCVSTLNDPARMCNVSPDRFPTMEQCRRVCLGDPRSRPQECEIGPLFSICSRQDVKPKWAFFDGKRCQQWTFPEGLCPAPNNTQVFGSLRECFSRCMPTARKPYGSLGTRCPIGMGPAGTCTADVLRFPYFAGYESGRFDCFRGSIKLLSENHCIVSPALFATEQDCVKTCVQVPVVPDICTRF